MRRLELDAPELSEQARALLLPRLQAGSLAQAEALLAIFEARGFELKDEIRTRIDTCPDPVVLKRWIMRAATASSAEQALAPERDPAPGS